MATGSWKSTVSAQTLLTLRELAPTAFFPVLNFPPWFTFNSGTCSLCAVEKGFSCPTMTQTIKETISQAYFSTLVSKNLYYHLCWLTQGITGVTASDLGCVMLCPISASPALRCKVMELQRAQRLEPRLSRSKSSSLRQINCALKL